MKFADYAKVKELAKENIFLIDGPNGTKTILVSDLVTALIGLLNEEGFISGVDMSELEPAEKVLGDNNLLIGTGDGNKSTTASALAKAMVGMLTSDELVGGLTLSELDKTSSLTETDYVMAGLKAGNRAISVRDLAVALPGMLSSREFSSYLKMAQLPPATAFNAEDMVLIGTSTGNQYMKAADAMFAMLDAFGTPEVHRNFFGGRNLGTTVTPAQQAAIRDGSFKGLFVGDYWVINGVTWRIADMDYFYHCGDTDFTQHHLVIVPDTSLYNAKMNDTSTTDGGYYNSKMRTEYLNDAKTAISNAFGSMVLAHKDYLTNAVTEGRPSAGAWYESTVELMNEIMVYGTHVYAPANNGVTIPNKYTTGKQQFALFALDPKKVNIRAYYWLRDVVSATDFARVNNVGIAYYNSATYSRGVRPYFCVG